MKYFTLLWIYICQGTFRYANVSVHDLVVNLNF